MFDLLIVLSLERHSLDGVRQMNNKETEALICNQWVGRSSLSGGNIIFKGLAEIRWAFCFFSQTYSQTNDGQTTLLSVISYLLAALLFGTRARLCASSSASVKPKFGKLSGYFIARK